MGTEAWEGEEGGRGEKWWAIKERGKGARREGGRDKEMSERYEFVSYE